MTDPEPREPSKGTEPPEGATPAGRRRRGSAAQRREQILDAARTLFAARGFHATTTRDLAQAADVNDALIYRHFPDKQAILVALVDQAIDGFQSLPGLDAAAGLPLPQLLELVGAGLVAKATEQLDLLTILLSEHQSLAGDQRFVRFIDGAATRLGSHLDGRLGLEPGEGYLVARSYMGSLIAFVLVQDVLGLDAIRHLDPGTYVHRLADQVARSLTPAGGGASAAR
jgi:AcrR family transcriptional regulator